MENIIEVHTKTAPILERKILNELVRCGEKWVEDVEVLSIKNGMIRFEVKQEDPIALDRRLKVAVISQYQMKLVELLEACECEEGVLTLDFLTTYKLYGRVRKKIVRIK